MRKGERERVKNRTRARTNTFWREKENDDVDDHHHPHRPFHQKEAEMLFIQTCVMLFVCWIHLSRLLFCTKQRSNSAQNTTESKTHHQNTLEWTIKVKEEHIKEF